jgi:hypothetical protein
MPSKKEKDIVKEQAAAQARIAGTQEAVGGQFLGYSAEDRARQIAAGGQISDVAGRLTADPYAGMARPARPDMTPAFGRQYADEQAAIEADKRRSLGDVADYMAGSGAARTGSAGSGMGAVFRGADVARTGARRTLQERQTGEKTAQFEDEVARYQDELARTGAGLEAGVQGANILERQQTIMDPTRTAAVGTTNLAQATASRGAAAQSQESAARMPGRWSWLGGLAGGALNLAANAAAPGSSGLRNIWRGATPSAAAPLRRAA